MSKRPSLRPVAFAALASAQMCVISTALAGCDDGIPGALIPRDSGGFFDVAKRDAAVDAAADAPDGFVPGPTVCDPKTVWTTGTLVPNVSTPQPDNLGAITGDELTIAWMSVAGTVQYADRAAATDPFGPAKTVTGPIALDRVALSGDGLTLVVLRGDRKIFAQVTRASRSVPFGAVLDTGPFSGLDPLSSGTEDAGDASSAANFGDPVLSADGHFFYYSVLAGGPATIAESYRSGNNPWPKGRFLTNAELAPDAGKLRRPTGLSTDGRTLFFWDEVDAVEKMAFRGDPIVVPFNVFGQFTVVGAFANAQPTTKCQRLYYDAPGSVGGTDLFFADPN